MQKVIYYLYHVWVILIAFGAIYVFEAEPVASYFNPIPQVKTDEAMPTTGPRAEAYSKYSVLVIVATILSTVFCISGLVIAIVFRAPKFAVGCYVVIVAYLLWKHAEVFVAWSVMKNQYDLLYYGV